MSSVCCMCGVCDDSHHAYYICSKKCSVLQTNFFEKEKEVCLIKIIYVLIHACDSANVVSAIHMHVIYMHLGGLYVYYKCMLI